MLEFLSAQTDLSSQDAVLRSVSQRLPVTPPHPLVMQNRPDVRRAAHQGTDLPGTVKRSKGLRLLWAFPHSTLRTFGTLSMTSSSVGVLPHRRRRRAVIRVGGQAEQAPARGGAGGPFAVEGAGVG